MNSRFKIYLAFLLIFALLLKTQSSFAQERYSRVSIQPGEKGMSELKDINLEADHGHFNEGRFITTLSSGDLIKLRNAAIPFTILIEDEQEYFLRENSKVGFYDNDYLPVEKNFNFSTPCSPQESSVTTPAAFTPGTMGGYYTFVEMVQKIDDMIAAYPNLISSKVNLGNSIEGRPIWMVKITGVNSQMPKPEALYTAIHHAREPNSMMQLIFFMQYLLENYGTDSEIQALVDERDLYFIPCINPDGYVYNQTTNPNGGGFHRKNRRDVGTSNKGVDLNRNYGFGWGYDNVGSSGNQNSSTYRGSAPFSEPELVAVRNFVNSRNFTISLHYHSYGNYLIRPWSVPNAPLNTPAEEAAYEKYGAMLTKHNCYFFGTDDETVGYSTNGVSDDWFWGGDLNLRGPVFAMTPEAGSGTDGFWPPQNRIIPIAKENLYTNIHTGYLAGNYARIEDWSAPGIYSSSGSLPFRLTRLGLKDGPLMVSLIGGENVASTGPPVIIPAGTMNNPLDTYDGSIDYTLVQGLPDQTHASFTFKVVAEGITFTEEVSKILNPASLVTDDMEGSFAAKWTTTAGWNYSGQKSFSGNQSLTDSPSADYTNSGTRSLYLNDPIDLSDATAAYLTFWLQHASQPCHDRLQIEISPGGAGSSSSPYLPLCGNLTITENREDLGGLPALTGERLEWTKAIFPLDDYLGQANLGLRIRLYLDASVTGDGFYLDDLQIVKKTTPIFLPVELLSFEAELRDQKDVLLNWTSATEVNLSKFEIQRSGNAVDFETIGSLAATNQTEGTVDYTFIDSSPFAGVNYYRLKLIDVNGEIEYSAVINIKVSASFALSGIYPNPVQDRVFFVYESPAEAEITIKIFDMLGREIVKAKRIIRQGDNSMEMDLSDIPAGAYLLHSSDGEHESSFRFIKE